MEYVTKKIHMVSIYPVIDTHVHTYIFSVSAVRLVDKSSCETTQLVHYRLKVRECIARILVLVPTD